MCQDSGKKVFTSETFFVDIPVNVLCKISERYAHISDPICRMIRLVLFRVKFIGLNNRKLLTGFQIFPGLGYIGYHSFFYFSSMGLIL
jgi:hypothetical protein